MGVLYALGGYLWCLNESLFSILAVNNIKRNTLWAAHATIWCCLKSEIKFIFDVLSAVSENNSEIIHMISVRAKQADAS